MKKHLKLLFLVGVIFLGFQAKSALANTCVYNGTTNNWTASAAWTGCGGVAPTAADDVLVGTGSGGSTTGSLTITAGSVARSADFTSFAGTLTQGSTGTLTLGDATAGAGNVALKMPSGFTYVPNSASTITFISTSATQQTVSSAYTMGNMTFNSASNGNYAITANLTLGTASIITLTNGTLHTDGTGDVSGLTHSWGAFISINANTRTVNFGTSSVTLTGSSGGSCLEIGAAGTANVTATSSNITCTGSSVLFAGGGKTWNNVTMTGANASSFGSSIYSGTFTFSGGGNMSITQIPTFGNLTITGKATKTDNFSLGNNITVTGVLTLTGFNAINRLLVKASTVGTPFIITVSGATVSVTNTDFRDILFDNGGSNLDLSAVTGGSGDCGGNGMSGGGTLTFTTGVTLHYQNANGGNWSTAGDWNTSPSATSRVPLPQDDVVIDKAFNSAKTLVLDMPRAGRSIDFTGMTFTGTKPIFTFNSVGSITVYGSVTLLSSTNMTWTLGSTFNFEGRAANMPVNGWKLTSAGQTMAPSAVFQGPAGTYQLQDALSASGNITLTFGTLDANSFNITATVFSSNNTNVRGVTMGTGTFTLTSTGSVWAPIGANFTYSGGTILINNTAATAKTFAGNNVTTYNIVTFAGDNITVTGNNTISTLNLSDAGFTNGVKFTGGSTTTITTAFTTNATTTAARAIATSTITTAAALSYTGAGNVCTDFLNINSIIGLPVSVWYVGANSTGTSNTNLTFTACPAGGVTVRRRSIIIFGL